MSDAHLPNTPPTDARERALHELRRVSRPWRVHPRLPAERLSRLSQPERLAEQLLTNRGLDQPAARAAFMSATWGAGEAISPHMARAAERIVRGLRGGERITVYGDFDCDGISSCAVLVETLRALAASPDSIIPRIPERDAEGRGLNREAIAAIAADGSTLIVTCDCGSSNVKEVALAGTLRIEVIVTDHHPPHGPLPNAYAIVNPRAQAESSAHHDLAGAGVAFRLAEAILRLASQDASSPSVDPSDTLRSLLDLVAIGTVGDIVALSAENWALVRAGVQRLNEAPRPGLRALMAHAGLAVGSVSARDISFAIAPRLNAAGRMESPMLALRLLITHDPREASALALSLEAINRSRQEQTEEIIAAARQQVRQQSGALIALGERWRQGVLGLVAGRLAEDRGLPAFVLSRESGQWRGSARGPEGSDLGAMLAGRPEFFTHFGGHARAAGFSLAAESVDGFVAFVREQFSPAGAPHADSQRETDDNGAGQELLVDCELPPHVMRDDHYATIASLEPYGPGFAEPTFLAPRVRVVSVRRSGMGRANLRLRLQSGGQTRDAVWSKRGDLEDTLRPALGSLPPMDVVYQLSRFVRSDTGRTEWLMRVIAMRPSA